MTERGRPLTNVDITHEMIAAGYEAIRCHDSDIYEMTPPKVIEPMLAAIFEAMTMASVRDGGPEAV